MLAAGRRRSVSEGRSVVHALPIGYALDGNRGIADPRGMVGRRLGVDMHVVTADTPPLRNLELAINRCHLSIEALVASPYASGLSVLVDDEAELGCAVIDFGGGTTTIAVFSRGEFVHVDALAVGGRHVTTDIARGLSIRLEDAERLKTMYGSALPGVGDEREMLSVRAIGDDERDVPNQVPRSALTRIIRPRIEEILELTRDRLNASGFASLVGRRMVLTGGASQLNGLAEAARRLLARNVRLGRPLGVAGLPEVAKGPAFADRGRAADLSRGRRHGADRYGRRRAFGADRNGRLSRPRRPVVQGEFLAAAGGGGERPRRRRTNGQTRPTGRARQTEVKTTRVP